MQQFFSFLFLLVCKGKLLRMFSGGGGRLLPNDSVGATVEEGHAHHARISSRKISDEAPPRERERESISPPLM